MSNIPKKINDTIENAIVGIRFHTDIPQEALNGMCYDILVNELGYERIQPNKIISTIPNVKIEIVPYFTHSTKKIRIDISENNIVFNITGKYVGWTDYRKYILETLKILFQKKIIKDIYRISMRYISVYQDIRIFEKTKIELTFGMELPSNLTTQIRTEFEQNGVFSIINLANGFKNTDDNIFSIIDIDTISLFQDKVISEIPAIEAILEKVHNQEVNLYFGLLKPDFLNSLNPKY
jgi:uncharacterized protein (TIGR04255 family)